MLLICRWPNGKHECALCIKKPRAVINKKVHAKFDNSSTRLLERPIASRLSLIYWPEQSKRFKWSVTAQHQSVIDDDDRETIMLMGLIDWKITHTGGMYWTRLALAIKLRVRLTAIVIHHGWYVCTFIHLTKASQPRLLLLTHDKTRDQIHFCSICLAIAMIA